LRRCLVARAFCFAAASDPPALNFIYVFLLALGFAAVEYLIGGTRLLFSLPTDGIFALAALLSVIELRRSKMRPNGFCLASSALFFGYILWRAIVSPVVYIAWYDEFMVLGALIVYLLVACYLTDPRRRIWLVLVLLAIAAVNLVIAARQFSGGDDYMFNGFIRSAAYRGRGSGLYICPDHLAGFLEVVGSLSLALAIWSRQPFWLKLLIGYGGICCFGGILLTASRGGALSATAALVTLAGLGLLRAWSGSPGSLLKALAVIAVVVALTAGGMVLALRGSNLLESRAKTLMDTKDVRLLLWPAAIQEFRLSPVIGTGAATYLYYGRVFRNPRVQTDPVRSHNDYLELLAEYGAAGAVGFLLFLGAHLGAGWHVFRRLSLRSRLAPMIGPVSSNAAAWNIGALAAVASFLVHSIFDFNLHIPANTFLLAFVFGTLANPGRNLHAGEDLPPERFRWPDLLPRLALPALGLWIIVAGLPKLPGEYYCEQARIALRNKRDLLAYHEAEQGLGREHQNPNLYFYLGEARQSIAGDRPDNDPLARSFREAAIEPYRAALSLYPEDSPVLLRLGEALTRLRDFRAAAPVFQQALKWDPNSATVYTYDGFFLQRAGRVAEAKSAYEHALALANVAAASEGLKEVSRQLVSTHPAE
jgi:O-antigen ligase